MASARSAVGSAESQTERAPKMASAAAEQR